jgi:ribosomal protein S13
MNRKPNPLPIRGQRTRSNARFWKGARKVIANKKKAPGPK